MKRILCILLLFLWMTGIFLFSAQPAVKSKNTSNMLKEKIISVVDKLFPGFRKEVEKPKTSAMLTFLIRKSAHLFMFFVLGILASINAIVWGFMKKWFVFLFCVLYALTDEIHQYFVPGRAMQLMDVCIDSFGALVGILFIFFLFKKSEKKRIRN